MCANFLLGEVLNEEIPIDSTQQACFVYLPLELGVLRAHTQDCDKSSVHLAIPIQIGF